MNTDMPKKLWTPSQETIEKANLTHYMRWLKENKITPADNYRSLWEWSVKEKEAFWESLWQYFDIQSGSDYRNVMGGSEMPGVRWFTGSTLNYAEHVFRNFSEERPAIVHKSERAHLEEVSWPVLKRKVASLRAFLEARGVEKGDRVAAFLPNIQEATIAFLAVNSLGAIWTSTSPDFGISSVMDRFAQVEPKVLIGVDGYQYNGKSFDRTGHINKICENLSYIEQVVIVPYLNKDPEFEFENYIFWEEALSSHKTDELNFARVPFDHPMWVLYSSGTTGLPKPITHSHGGMLMEHLKYLTFHNDLKPGERCFWYTTTGWMMWNYVQACLLCRTTIVLYDGSPAWPDLNVLWGFAEEAGITHFGTSAGFIVANIKKQTHPGKDFDLSVMRSIGSTGAPLPPEGFDWAYEEVKEDLWLASISGGTDVCSAFVGGNPLWPVYSGEIQCRALGCKLEAFDPEGKPLYDEVGEMVITEPMPCMPVYFWNDPDEKRYISSYFEQYPGIWRHGDWTRITPRDGVVIYGRSDSTLNRGGVRIGTSEVYRAVDKIPEIQDSIIVCVDTRDNRQYMPLFVVMQENQSLNEQLKEKIKSTIRYEYSPRHVPDDIFEIEEVPYTISGKKVETPVKKILQGTHTETAIKRDALKNPDSIIFFEKFASQMG